MSYWQNIGKIDDPYSYIAHCLETGFFTVIYLSAELHILNDDRFNLWTVLSSQREFSLDGFLLSVTDSKRDLLRSVASWSGREVAAEVKRSMMALSR